MGVFHSCRSSLSQRQGEQGEAGPPNNAKLFSFTVFWFEKRGSGSGVFCLAASAGAAFVGFLREAARLAVAA